MSLPTKTRQHVLAEPPLGEVDINKVFKLVDKDLPTLESGQVLVQALMYSNDPAQRTWIQAEQDPERLYVPPVPKNGVMRAYAVAKVLESKSDKISKGSLVLGAVGWTEYAVLGADTLLPVEPVGDLSPSHFLGAFGLTGRTALYGLRRVKTSSDDNLVVISGAAGATGSLAVQIAKHIIGVRRVVGIAGSDDKCRWVESLGADKCLNYKASSFKDDLARECGGKVDVYFDNVGGQILDLMLAQMKRHGRVAVCGAISQYDSITEPVGFVNWAQVIYMRIEITGFIVLDGQSDFPEMTETLVNGYKSGKIKLDNSAETVVDTKFEDVPKTWRKLFSGGNQGKLVTSITW